MINANPLFLLTKMSGNTRIFIAVSIIASYGLFLYELLPEYLFIPESSIIYFGMPTIAIASLLVFIPKLLSKSGKDLSSQTSMNPSEAASQQGVEMISLEESSNQGMILPDSDSPGMVQGIIQGQVSLTGNAQPPAVIQGPVVDEVAIQDMVSRVIEPVQKDNTRMQDTVSDLRNEINSIKSSMDSLSATVESSLTDLKSFQAELANPLNFMRKYFDSIDIKSLSDPSLPLHMEHLPLSDPVQNSSFEKKDSAINKNEAVENHSYNNKSLETLQEQTVKNQDTDEVLTNSSQDVLAFKQMLGGKLTMGKLMTTISLMEEILQTLGRESIDVLIDQCKLMGLNQEDEHIVYNVVNMMDKSGLSVNDTLIMLYKFGKVMGMNDRESDLIYAKLMMNQTKNHDNVIAVEKKAG